jgi:5-methylcytosine-specific restriction endonuclease McrA
MSRSLAEWVAKNDDQTPPPRVRLRVLMKFDRCCAGCGVSLHGRPWTCDHIVALINGGENRESNLQPLGDKCCNPKKNAADVAEKSKTYRVQAKHYGVKKRRRTIPGRKFDGTPIPPRWVD